MALIRATAEAIGNDEYDLRVGIEWAGEQPLSIVTTDNSGLTYEGISTPCITTCLSRPRAHLVAPAAWGAGTLKALALHESGAPRRWRKYKLCTPDADVHVERQQIILVLEGAGRPVTARSFVYRPPAPGTPAGG